VQEAIDLTMLAFDLAEKYRTLVFVAADGAIGQMMEPAELPEMQPLPEKRPPWALTGAKRRPKNIVTSLYLGADQLEKLNEQLQCKLYEIQDYEVRWEPYRLDDAEIVLVAFGTAARVAQTAVNNLRRQGHAVGLFRPITLWPFPEWQLAQLVPKTDIFFVVEMNAGQMVHDVREVVGRGVPVESVGRMGGTIPMPDEIETEVQSWLTFQRSVRKHGWMENLTWVH
jgi:2-oxoglutarate ferredoxin oxidoreductase subunit alpha